MAQRPFLYCFSNDLRLEDHAGLAAAAARGDVLPVLVLDAAMDERLRGSPRRAAFYCGAVRALAEELCERGSTLVVRRGSRAAVLPDLLRATGAAGAAWSVSYGNDDEGCDPALRAALEERGYAALIVHDAPAVAPDEVEASSGTGYRAFAPYFERWWSRPVPSYEHPLLLRFACAAVASEALPQPSEFGSPEPSASTGAATARRAADVFFAGAANRYAAAASLPAQNATSGLAPHLSFGTISARSVVRRARERFADPFALAESRASLRLFLRELARRDFFLQLAWFHPQTADRPLQEKMADFTPDRDHPALEAWRTGLTGYPLVDAGMRQLRATGWMHPQVRAVAASFLCFDLALDWRIGREQWDRWLVEDEPALATGNWQWIAGVGADMAQFPRIYNPQRQRRRCDPVGEYVRRWIPELREVPAAEWHGRSRDSAQLLLALSGSEAYPRPVLDHARAARAFLARYRAFVSP